MSYRSLRHCVEDLRQSGQLIEIREPVDARLEVAEIQRRVFARQGPAVLFANVTGCRFPMLGNLFGTLDRAQFIFRHTLEPVRRAIALKLDPGLIAKHPLKYLPALRAASRMRPLRRRRSAVTAHRCQISDLPQQVSWPRDGGAFITLPQVYTEDIRRPGPAQANLGMYRVQLSGGEYALNRQIGLHYQIHRGIGVHHQLALESNRPLRVSVFVGGHPAMTLAAVMPLPEGMTELGFAGALAGRRIPLQRVGESLIYADADFCIVGTVDPQLRLPEGPFGDHLGYYSLQHPFPVLNVEAVYHRADAIWPFTSVGRPPQEDTIFGQLIHELTASVIPSVLPGVRAVHAVDAAGVHPLLLAIGSERYTPYEPITAPQEILTQAHAILGQGQLSLAKYLWILDGVSCPSADVHQVQSFFEHILQRVDWTRDLHFITQTSMDTLDYSGGELNRGSKLIIAAAGSPIRRLGSRWTTESLPAGFAKPRVVMPGVLAVEGEPHRGNNPAGPTLAERLFQSAAVADWDEFPLVAVVDDSEFTARSLENFLWVVFTRSNPAADIDGLGPFVHQKHWGCRGSLLIDARTKPHHAPVLESDPAVVARVDALAAAGGPLAPYL